jgi:hypothetical protein
MTGCLFERSSAARIHSAGIHRNRSTNLLFQTGAHGLNQIMYFSSRQDRPHRIIFMGLWDTEQGHDSVADKFLDEPFVFGDYLRNLPEDPTHNLFDFFRVQLFRHGGIVSARPVVSAKKVEAYRIFVDDNGIGFNEKALGKIFAPFQRLHGRSEYEGVGMGLAICKKIVERHGGEITAKSELGRGSTFIVTLPANRKQE